MPTYVYACERCGEFEQRQSITAPPLERCPECDGAVRRLISGGSGFIMRGARPSPAPHACSGGCCQPAPSCEDAGCPALK